MTCHSTEIDGDLGRFTMVLGGFFETLGWLPTGSDVYMGTKVVGPCRSSKTFQRYQTHVLTRRH